MMKLDQVIEMVRKVGEYFQSRSPMDKVVAGGLFLSVVLAVLSRVDVAFVFIAAASLGGWAAQRLVGNRARVFPSRHLLPFLPNLVDHFKEKRKRAGLSILPNFEIDLSKYSVNGSRSAKMKNTHQTCQRKICQLKLPSDLLPKTVDEEFQQLIKSVMHDFVLSWYSVYVSDHNQISEELLSILLNTFENLGTRLHFISKRNLLTDFLIEMRTHVYRFQRACSSLRKLRSGRQIDSNSLVASYETFCLMHPAIQDPKTEMNYLKSAMKVLLHSAVPQSVTECRASSAVLLEILTCNLLVPLLDLLSDPDFLYRLIHLIVSSIVSVPETTGAQSDSVDSSKPKMPSPVFPNQQSVSTTSQMCESNQPSASCFPFDSVQIRPRSNSKPAVEVQRDQEVPFQLEPRGLNVVQGANPTANSSLSRVPVSRSVDGLDVPSKCSVSSGSRFAGNSVSAAFSRHGHRRAASDSSVNPALSAFIAGDAIPMTRLGPSPRDVNPSPRAANQVIASSATMCIPRPPPEGAENTLNQVTIPLTTLEPAIVVAQRIESDSRPRNSSSESFASIDYENNQMDTQFCDIDNQFALEEHSRSPSAASSTASGILSVSQIKQSESTNEIDGAVATHSKGNRDANSTPRRILSSSDTANSKAAFDASKPTCAAEIPSLSPPPAPVASVDPQLRDTALNVNTTGSSPIKKVLQHVRRVSLSKKNRPEPVKTETASTGSLSVVSTKQQSAPVVIPTSIKVTAPASSRSPQEKTQPPLSPICPTISISDEMKTIPTAGNPRIMSASAPEMSNLEPAMESTDDLFQTRIINLEIPKAEVCKESGGKGEYFLYLIQFDVLQTVSPSSSAENLERCDAIPVHKTAKRRHREFVNLHSRLEHNPQLKLSLKGIRDVPKRLSIPLAPTAKAAIDQRRIGHQRYLQQLLSKPVLHCSSEVSEFLALEGNTHIEFVRHHPREYVPRIDKMLRSRVSGLVDTIKQVKSAIPRALSDLGPLPPMSPPTSPIKKSKSSRETGKRLLSPPGSPRSRSPSFDEQDGDSSERLVTFERRPKTTLQLAMCSVIQDNSLQTFTSSSSLPYPTAATTSTGDHLLGPRSVGDGCESPDASVAETQSGPESTVVLGMEQVALFDSLLCLLGEAFHDKELWFLDEGLQRVLTILAGDLLDGWLERQVELLLSEHWCAFYLAELREVLWPGRKLLSASEGWGKRTETEKAATIKDILTLLVDSMPESFYKVVKRKDWQDGLQLLLDSLGDTQLNRHLMFTALDLLLDALISEIKDESFQKDLLSRI